MVFLRSAFSPIPYRVHNSGDSLETNTLDDQNEEVR